MTSPNALPDAVAIRRATEMLRAAKLVVVLTGAGVSKESGVPTFRDAMEGLWANFDPEQLATPQAFQRNPKLVWDWYEHRRKQLDSVRPNPGHFALAELERLLPKVVIVTQNVDGLHRAAGSTDVIELHGDIRQHKCFDDCQGAPTLVDLASLQASGQYDERDAQAGPPICPYCKRGLVRPNVVWFMEMLPPAALERAFTLAQTCDLMLVVGTSGAVQPAASLPYLTKRRGGRVIDVNPHEDEIAPICDLFLQGPSGQVLPEVVKALREG